MFVSFKRAARESVELRAEIAAEARTRAGRSARTPNLPTKITPAKIRRLICSGEFPVDMRSLPLATKIMLD